MSRCFRSFVQPSSTPVSKFISNHPSLYLQEKKISNMKGLQMLLAQVIIRGFSGSPNPEIAIDLFVQMLVVGLLIQPGGLTYLSVFKDYTQLGLAKDGAQLHGKVVKSGLEFDRFIRSTMISIHAYYGFLSEANLGALEQGKWIHTYMKMHNVKLNVIVITALINMYFRCEDIKTAYRVFENTTLCYNVLTCWNTIIMGLATNGFQNEAIQLFSRLLQPVSVSFIDVLIACNDSGLVNEAKNYLTMMKTVYNIKPMNPDAAIWNSLLSAARFHKNFKIARREAEKLAQLEPDESSSSYTLMSNVHMLPRAIS